MFNNLNAIRFLGATAVLFFGLGVFIGIKRLVKSKTILIVDSIGLKLNPNKSFSAVINWDEILGFEEIKIHGASFIVIRVKNPEFWIKRENNKVRKSMMKFNNNNYSSPFNISASIIDISHKELLLFLNSYFDKYNK